MYLPPHAGMVNGNACYCSTEACAAIVCAASQIYAFLTLKAALKASVFVNYLIQISEMNESGNDLFYLIIMRQICFKASNGIDDKESPGCGPKKIPASAAGILNEVLRHETAGLPGRRRN